MRQTFLASITTVPVEGMISSLMYTPISKYHALTLFSGTLSSLFDRFGTIYLCGLFWNASVNGTDSQVSPTAI